MTMTYDQLRSALKISKHALDDALEEQPQLFLDVSEQYARAISNRDGLKDQLKQVDAELFVECKKTLDDAGEKTTGERILAEVNRHEDHAAAVQEHLDACKEADKWQTLRDAYHQRSYALKELGDLYIASYWQQGSVDSTAAQADEVRAKKARQRVTAARQERDQESRERPVING